MKSVRTAALTVAFFLILAGTFAQQTATVSEKQDVAVFALGYYGYNIPLETLASVDAEVQSVFVNLGRFNVFGSTERFKSADVQAFIDKLKTLKENSTPLPEELKFGDVQMTQDLYNKLYGAFVVVIPTITDFNSQYNNSARRWETTLKTSVAFISVSTGSTLGFANIVTTGQSKETQYKSIKQSMDGLAPQLSFEIRKIPAFTLNSKVLQVRGGEVKLQLGRDMGVQVGDEYAVIEKTQVAGFSDDREDGLLLIKNVGPQISTATVLYAGKTLAEGAQLREIPRLGIDVEPYLEYLKYFSPVTGWELGSTTDAVSEGVLAAGVKGVVSRGFYGMRPLVGVQINFDTNLWLPIIAYAGAEYNAYLRRLTLTGSAALAVASNAIVRLIQENVSENDNDWFTHVGLRADAGLGFLVSRDARVFANVDFSYLFGIASSLDGPFQSYGGYGVTVGVALKK